MSRPLRGRGYQGFCGDISESLLLKSVTKGAGAGGCQKFCAAIYERYLCKRLSRDLKKTIQFGLVAEKSWEPLLQSESLFDIITSPQNLQKLVLFKKGGYSKFFSAHTTHTQHIFCTHSRILTHTYTHLYTRKRCNNS